MIFKIKLNRKTIMKCGIEYGSQCTVTMLVSVQRKCCSFNQPEFNNICF